MVSDVIVALVAVFVLVWTGASLLYDAWLRRRHCPSLLERLAPYQPRSVAGQVRRWLDSQ
jgi:hypothetical protein